MQTWRRPHLQSSSFMCKFCSSCSRGHLASNSQPLTTNWQLRRRRENDWTNGKRKSLDTLLTPWYWIWPKSARICGKMGEVTVLSSRRRYPLPFFLFFYQGGCSHPDSFHCFALTCVHVRLQGVGRRNHVQFTFICHLVRKGQQNHFFVQGESIKKSSKRLRTSLQS